MKNVCLFVIDPQVDFCDPKGNLFVAGADKDMERLAEMVKKNKDQIDDIQITLDSHNLVHIAHPISWINIKGENPTPFTLISLDDVKNGVWKAKNPSFRKRFEEYVQKLSDNARYPLCIWPPHCLIGSPGHNIAPAFYEAMMEWENLYAVAGKTIKGSNPFTEHYSAVRADVEDPEDSGTRLNTKLIELLKKYDKILIAGEALSHCVANTIRDVANEFSEEQIKKFILLEDASSSVTGFEQMGESFVKEMKGKGMEVAKTTTVF